MNKQFDVIIIGDSKAGNEALKNVASESNAIKLAFISSDFKNSTTRDFINVEYFKNTVTLIDYRNRLFGCYLDNGDRFYCTHLVIATGLCYEPLIIRNKQVPNVYNNVDHLDKSTKQLQALVLGNNDTEVKLALSAAKKYKYVYLCSSTFELDITESTRKKLEFAENIVVLPNTNISKVTITDDKLSTVELDNYSTLTCSAIFIKSKAIPETSFITERIISKDENGYLKTSNISQSLLVPKCYAVGKCAEKSTKTMTLAMINDILQDFGGKQ